VVDADAVAACEWGGGGVGGWWWWWWWWSGGVMGWTLHDQLDAVGVTLPHVASPLPRCEQTLRACSSPTAPSGATSGARWTHASPTAPSQRSGCSTGWTAGRWTWGRRRATWRPARTLTAALAARRVCGWSGAGSAGVDSNGVADRSRAGQLRPDVLASHPATTLHHRAFNAHECPYAQAMSRMLARCSPAWERWTLRGGWTWRTGTYSAGGEQGRAGQGRDLLCWW